MVIDQPLVTGQFSFCTGEGCAPVHLLAGYQVERQLPGPLVDIQVNGVLGYDPGWVYKGMGHIQSLGWVCTWHHVGAHNLGGGDVACMKGIGLSCLAQTRGHWNCNIEICTLISALVAEI